MQEKVRQQKCKYGQDGATLNAGSGPCCSLRTNVQKLPANEQRALVVAGLQSMSSACGPPGLIFPRSLSLETMSWILLFGTSIAQRQ